MPNILTKHEKEENQTTKWQVDWNWGTNHEAYHDDMHMLMKESNIMRFSNNSFSCGKWEKSDIPCKHAITEIAFYREGPLTYISEWFRKDTFIRAFQLTINLVNSRRFWPTRPYGPKLTLYPRGYLIDMQRKGRERPLGKERQHKTYKGREAPQVWNLQCGRSQQEKLLDKANIISLLRTSPVLFIFFIPL